MGREIKIEAPELRLDPSQVVESIDWTDLLGAAGPVEVEVGIGKGRFLLAAAAARPDVQHVGIEYANKYLRVAESRARKRGLTNVRFVRVDAKEMIPAIPDRSVEAFYVFYPDPWPKKRQHKRRFFDAPTVAHLARALVAGGWLHVVTDHDDYWSVIEPLVDREPGFERQAEFGGPQFPLPTDGALTNFEEKYGREGRSRHRASWRARPAPER